MVVLLVDDERAFADGRECVTARTVQEAINATENLDSLDELWLDYVLLGTDSTDEFLFRLVRERKYAGNPLKIHKVFIHTSAYGAISLLKDILGRLDVAEENITVVSWQEYLVKVA